MRKKRVKFADKYRHLYNSLKIKKDSLVIVDEIGEICKLQGIYYAPKHLRGRLRTFYVLKKKIQILF